MPLSSDYVNSVAEVAKNDSILVHVDGARIFNAAVSLDTPVAKLTDEIDSVSFCLSKGLSAPAGSLLCGPEDFIYRARRNRKALGGGMRQVGIVAAGGLFALKFNRERLREDHLKAEKVFDVIIERFGEDSASLATNMIHVNLADTKFTGFVPHLKKHGVILSSPRFVFHMGISESDLDRLIRIISSFKSK